MNIVERIQKEYPPNWFAMDDGLSRMLWLEFQPEIAPELQNRLRETLLDRFALRLSPDAERRLYLKVDEKPGCYQLLQDGQPLFRFCQDASVPGTDYNDCVEAVAWVIYLLSTAASKPLLDLLRGGYISCRILCARQQRIAAEYRAFTQNQYGNNSCDNRNYKKLCERLATCCGKFVREAPLPSCQPICSNGFQKLKKSIFGIRNRETCSVEALCELLFGDKDFARVIDLYSEHVKKSEPYRLALEKAKKALAEDVRKVPIAAANSYLSGLLHYINQISPEVPGTIQCDAVSLTRNCKYLCEALEELDDAWKSYAKKKLEKEFLLQVQQAVDAQMDEELKQASRVVQDARISLKHFSVLAEGARTDLTWQYLAQPETADIYVPDTEWNCESFSALQRVITNNDAWLCSQKLLDAMKQENGFAQGMDRTFGVPLSTDQYVWVFWRTEE